LGLVECAGAENMKIKIIEALMRNLRSADSAVESLRALVAGCANQSDLLNRKLNQMIAGLDNQSDLFNRKLNEVIAGLNKQSDLLNRKLDQVIAGLDNQSGLFNRQLDRLTERIAAGYPARSHDLANASTPSSQALSAPPLRQTNQDPSLLISEQDYDTARPNHGARDVRHCPGCVLNHSGPTENPAFLALSRFAEGDCVPEQAWDAVLGETFVEAASVPHAAQVFARRSYAEHYLSELDRRHCGHYQPGWVDHEEAFFLYWLVRRLKPRTILQTGVCNGLSTAFMMLALAKNGSDGGLRAIDLPPIFDPCDPSWTVEGKVYGGVIPEGKTSGWLVPEAYHERLEIWHGNARDLLPKMVDEVDSIDLFYHDCDHSYDHTMFEFHQAKRKLSKGGLIVAADIGLNAPLWDFADQCGVPSYNFKGSVGVAFF
jgi:predicted O-methyltransferase YrrM